MKGFVFDGQKKAFIPLLSAAVPIMDIGFQRSAGVFETLLAYNGLPFHLNDHLKRLQLSARLLGIREHFMPSYLEEKVMMGLKKVKSPIISIKIIITGGDSSYLTFESPPRLYIIFTPFTLPAKEFYEKGVALLSTPILRTLPSVKSLNYLAAVISHTKARKKKYYDSIYVNKNHILEGTTFNFGIIIKNNLIVPIDNVLEGITMQAVIKMGKSAGLNIFRKPITMKELRRSDEAFLTSSYREIMPVVKIDEIKIGNGKPGHYSRLLQELYQKEK